jgi:hypothetical protein
VEVPLDVKDGVASLTTEGFLQAMGLVKSGVLERTLRPGGCDGAVRSGTVPAEVAEFASCSPEGDGE